ncbi:MAG TPA: DUF3810 family protein [Vicinamibacterales bacterium]|jgi:hypothetical protein|nr:DUF3810 family protein [Vicinamibacterales bacterium]
MARTRIGAYVRGWIVLPIVAAIAVLVPVPAWFVDELYSHDIYPWWQTIATGISNLVPIALLDIFILLAIGLLLFRAVQLARAALSRGVLSAVWEGVRRALRAAAVLVLVFFFAWGCQYRRSPLESGLHFTPAQPSVASLQAAIVDSNAIAASLRPRLPPGDAMTYDAAAEALRAPMNDALVALKLAPLARPGRPKFSLLLTPFFTWAGVNGMINPIALESLVHPDLLPFERPFVLAHEWAHLAGEADEADASAVGWLACMKGGPMLAYSASLYLIMEAGGALPAQARQHAFAKLDPGVRSDLALIAKRARLQKPRVQRAAFEVYDQYLKANSVEDGTASYGRALTLILSDPFQAALNSYTAKTKDQS